MDVRAIGGRLRDARRVNSMRQDEVAAELGKTRQTISRWEQGDAQPSLLEFRDLAILYGQSTDWLIFGIPTAPLGGRLLRDIFREWEADGERPFGL
jgi:transcriptional regulator with XRE-family HTH domain